VDIRGEHAFINQLESSVTIYATVYDGIMSTAIVFKDWNTCDE
jgi:hypothetical protein